ncbi:phospholipase D-like domain-containing protein [Holophaga foetida]|uniref:phospholipase D-like domain-containing protein n=1 Tax=Holophaga foetida TaxID=35839 RepID=UPI00130E5525|nr:phospholipase D-like domain-containing protein [Holophaga foetida]
MRGALGAAFSHHQKSVIIDNKYAYVGGIDLAYGRMDDHRFSINAEWRRNNELYNSCIPPVHSVTNEDRVNHLTRAELLAACSDNWKAETVAWGLSAPFPWLAKVLDAKDTATSGIKDGSKMLSDAWNSSSIVPDFLYSLQDKAVDAAAEEVRQAWRRLPAGTKNTLRFLVEVGCASVKDASTAVVAWLNGASLEQLPQSYLHTVGSMVEALTLGIVTVLGDSAANRKELYRNLGKLPHIAPTGESVVDPKCQPRMPWHDVHCCIQGPSVYDLSMNFIQRWNSIAWLYDHEFRERAEALTQQISRLIHCNLAIKVKAPRIPTGLFPKESFAENGASVQVLRSAPSALLEDIVRAKGVPTTVRNARAYTKGQKQDNCLKAMLKVIRSAQHFIYIENQFFQSDYGAKGDTHGKYSGPMGALLDIKRSPAYQKFAKMLEIERVPLDKILKHIRWAKVDDVLRDRDGVLFWKDLMDVLKNHAAVKATTGLGHNQKHVTNPIAQALVWRIRKAIVEDGRDFHVYLVIPVHPEGTLNTLNIMTQVHLTMQSLSHGHDSLINGVRRAILEKRMLKEKGFKPSDAGAAQIRSELRNMGLKKLSDDVGDEWRRYLTLLNLRNWGMIGGRPVTEQVYVHSKTLIADDRVAIVGSANINDRSEMGDRDSELAVMIHDSNQVGVKLDGRHPHKVSACVHELRKNLWKKIFGLMGSDKPASALASVLDKPAAPETWKAIQKVARVNSERYEEAFWHIPRNIADPRFQAPAHKDDKPPCSIWPVWRYNDSLHHAKGGKMLYRMPFEAAFWQGVGVRDESNSWQTGAKAANHGRAPEKAPQGVQGFIVELPIEWTRGESNDSGQNLTILAQKEGLPTLDGLEPERPMLAQLESTPEETSA